MLRDDRIDWETIWPALAGVVRVAVVAGFAGLVVAELALRLAGLPTGATHRARGAYDLEDQVPGPYRPGARIEIAWPPETAYRATFNSWGMRGAEPRDGTRRRASSRSAIPRPSGSACRTTRPGRRASTRTSPRRVTRTPCSTSRARIS